jgi:cohesin loading factor subunit SCC2
VKRKLDRLDEVQTSDQRALSDEALQTLHDHVSDILDAEESLEAHEMHDSESYFITIQGENGASLTLAPAVQVKLETQLQKVISLGRFKDVPVENLLRIHKLCENALIHAESIDIAIQPGWSDDDTTSWLEHMETVENASRSARTALRIMTGGRTEKQIYSEELLQRVIGLLCKMTDTCLVPMVEARSTDGDLAVFQLTSSNKKTMSQFMHHASKLMSLLLDLLAKEELAESAVTSVEFFVIRLLFVENAQAEKDSVLGIHKFETFRRSAMNIIAAIFSRYPDQRHFIISEVLTSLQKLPTQKARARQYKLGDGKRLQLVSVLLIRLVQTSGTRTLSSNSGSKRQPTALGEDVDAESAAGSITSDVERKEKSDFEDGSEDEHHSMTNDGAAIPRRLIDNAKKLYESAGSSAQHIVKFLVHRASSSTKTGDEPHRPLLDMFVEDLVTVFSLPDWPAAELLLRALVTNMVEILNDQKRPVPAKNMALEVLGMMATAILDVSASARHMAKGIENADTSLSDQLAQYIEDHEDGQVELAEMTSWKGPFRIVMQYLIENSSDAQSLSAQGYFTTQWTKLVIWGNGSANEKPKNDVLGDSQRGVGLKLCKTLYVGKWSITEEFDAVSYTQCRLAYLLTLLNVGFCRALPHITNALVAACSSDQARIKTRSLKSVTQMVEKEPLLLDRLPQVKNLMFRCITDASSQVRDNTLALISQCITAKPGLENQFLKPILMCADDSSPSLRRRSIRVMKDIYLRHNFNDSPASKDIRAIVSETMLKLVDDLDEGTRELTRQTFEEIWLGPYWKACRTGELSVHDKVAIKGQLSLMVHTVQRGERVSSIFEAFLKYAFSEKSKQKSLNQKVSSALVAAGFEGVIDPSEVPGQPEQRSILQCMAVFARAEPTLFSQQQVACLQPYIIELKSTDDLDLFRESVIILRCVLPTLPTVQKDFLKKIQDDLIKNITKLAKAELNEVAICLWTINGVLQNIERLVTVVTSVLKRLQTLQDVKFTHDGQVEVKQTQRLVLLAGHFGRHCNFESQLDRFTASISRLKAPFVATRIVDAIKPFATKAQPPTLRATALESIGMVCQAWPRNYTLPEVIRAFQEVLRGPDHNLQQIVLASFRDFFATQDQQFTIIALSGERDPLRGGKIGGSMTASDNDGAAALIAQGFLGDILRIAMSSLEEFALTATEVMASITRQGLVHPKECGPALVALETSTNERIAEVALQQHQNLHQQHESMFEREYIRAIFEAYKYQRDIVKETRGYIRRDGQLRAKLHSMYEVVKTSKSKYQAKFIAGYCSKINFDFAKEESVNQLEQHLDYARFLIENMAFFDFGRADDVAYAISCMESIVANTGAGLAHAINTEVFKVTLDPETGAPANVPDDAGNSAFDISDEKLNRLTLASVILSMLWAARSYVRHLYGISSKDKSKDAKGKATKDIKAITKNNAVTGDKFVESIERISHALDSRDTALTQCRSFAELLSIDSEVQVTAEGENDEDGAVRMQTPSGDEDDRMTPASGGRKLVKRKSSMSLLDSPMKKRRGRPPGSRNKNRSTDRKSMDRDEESD